MDCSAIKKRVDTLLQRYRPVLSCQVSLLAYFLGGVVVVDEEDDERFVFRLLLPVDPLLVRSVVFIESFVPVVVPLFIEPVPVEYEPVVPVPVVPVVVPVVPV